MRIDFDTTDVHPLTTASEIARKHRATTPTEPRGKALLNAGMAPRQNRDTVRELGRFELKGDKMVPVLADTIPPTEPPPPVALAQPKAHRVVAWRHDGGIDNTELATLELAREFAARCHWAIYWKTMIMCGREMVARALIEEPRA